MPSPRQHREQVARNLAQGPLIPERLYGIIGGSLSHSLSPLLHNWGFRREGLPFCYYAFEIASEEVAAFMVACRTLPISGASVTIPHKRAVVPYLDELTEAALAAGAVNTLFWHGEALWGDNTDSYGFIAPLLQHGLRLESAVILGAGGAALACIQGLRRIGVRDIVVTARQSSKAETLARRLGVRSLPWGERDSLQADLLINATPLGTSGPLEADSPVPRDSLAGFRWVYDLVYNPVETVLLRQAGDMGCTGISGLDMFVHQGLAQFERWTGRSLPEEESLELLRTAMQTRGSARAP